ncbi:serine/threonine-protein kinase-like protein At3g51990 [Curcuma longa]|uniref:serine/threonine-protein kinase-like protein At3g51990 n=1 Tax=Curcuma longa TaxID=136217 RepID=UPI003D9F5D25
MGYLSCRADSSIVASRSFSATSAVIPSQQIPDLDSGGSSTHTREFNYQELESATGNFSDEALLGRGSHGTVYKAVLRGGRLVAVKRPSRRHFDLSSPSPPSTAAAPTRDEVENEIAIMSGIRSPRIVNLIGFTPSTPDRKERLLVVEFMPNGTLYDLLHSDRHPPGWTRRLRLALQTAKALRTLHSVQPPVIHRDVKSENVLIDQNFNARLGDFGLALRDEANAQIPFRSTPPAGTLGYLDPSYVTPENLSTKTDVFSFGILLLEIMSGRKAIDVAYSPPSVMEWAVPLLRKGKVVTLFDPRIAPPKDPAARKQLASLAASCVKSYKEMRPSMQEVVEQLKVLSKTVSSRAWNSLSIASPCSVVDVEKTLTKRNARAWIGLWSSGSSIFADKEPIAKVEDLPVVVKKSPVIVNQSRSLRTRNMLSQKTKGSTNLLELMAQPDAALAVSSNNRARTLQAVHDFHESAASFQLRNRTVTNNKLKSFFSSNLSINDIDRLDEKANDQTTDRL